MKKAQQKRKSPALQSGKGSPESYVAIVPVKISISHGDTKLDEYEDEITIEFSRDTPEGKENIGRVLYLTTEKGLSTNEALFVVASKAAEEFSQQLVAGVHATPPVELKVSIKRNGDISYAKSVPYGEET